MKMLMFVFAMVGVFEYFLGSVIFWAIKSDGKNILIKYKRDMILVPVIFILPVKMIYILIYGIKEIIKKYKKTPSLRQEKIILKEKAQMQSGNLSIVQNNDNEGRLSVV